MTLSERLISGARAFLDGGRAPTSLVRSDATVAPSTSGSSGAAVTNEFSGLGGVRDSGALARPNVERQYLDDAELIALLRGTIYRRTVELKPKWATTRGWTLTDDTKTERPLGGAMKRINLQRVIRDGDFWGRALGEARGLLVTDEVGRPSLEEPLDLRKVKRLHRIELFDRREFTPLRFNRDITNGPLGEPSHYNLHPIRPGLSAPQVPVHASRLLRFYGDDLPPSERGFNWSAPGGWGADAIGQTLWDGIRHLSQMGSAGAKVAQELTIAVFKLKGEAKSTGDRRAEYLSKIQILNWCKSVVQAVWLGIEESFERVAANPTGFEALSEHAKFEFASLTGYPMPLFFGMAPGGLNADGESWQAAWFADVAAHQEDRYRDPIERVVEVLYQSELGGVPDEWALSFNPLGDVTDKEKAEIRKLHTEADDSAVLAGILTKEEARSRYTQPGGFRTELQPVPEVVPEDAEPDRRLRPLPGATPEEAKAIEELDREQRREQRQIAPPRADATEGACWVGIPLPESAHAAWLAARQAVASVVGDLGEPGDPPHITLLYLGQLGVDAESGVQEVAAAVEDVAGRTSPVQLEASRVLCFPAGKDGVPVVLDVGGSWKLEELHRQLLPRVAHLITAKQFPAYRAHVTLGYAQSLTAEQQAKAMEVALPTDEEGRPALRFMVARAEVRYGTEVVAVVPMTGRADQEG